MSGAAIRRARLLEVALPLSAPFALSGGTMRTRRSLIVELTDADGHIGLGESAPFDAPFYSAETIASARVCLTDWLLPRLLRHPVEDSAELGAVLAEGIRGNRMARAGAETAWWDLKAARLGVPLVELVTKRLGELGVGGRWIERRDHITCGIAVGIPDRDDSDGLRDAVRAAGARGYRRIKLKVRPGWDEAAVRVTREVMADGGWELPLTVDANGGYHPERDLARLERLDRLGTLYIEQPFPGDSLWDLAELGRRLATPLCLDESLTSDDVARQVVDMGGPLVWNIKVQRVGGLEEACRIYARAARVGARVWGGTMPETGLGAQAMLALGAHGGFVYPSDLEPSERWYGADTDVVELVMEADGTMAVPRRRPPVRLGRRARVRYDSATSG